MGRLSVCCTGNFLSLLLLYNSLKHNSTLFIDLLLNKWIDIYIIYFLIYLWPVTFSKNYVWCEERYLPPTTSGNKCYQEPKVKKKKKQCCDPSMLIGCWEKCDSDMSPSPPKRWTLAFHTDMCRHQSVSKDNGKTSSKTQRSYLSKGCARTKRYESEIKKRKHFTTG